MTSKCMGLESMPPQHRHATWPCAGDCFLAAAPEFLLLLDELTRRVDILADEDVERELHVGHHVRVQLGQLNLTFIREFARRIHVFTGEMQQVLFDDVANVLELHGKHGEFHTAPAFIVIELVTTHLYQIMLNRIVHGINLVTHVGKPFDDEFVVSLKNLQRFAQHHLYPIRHAQNVSNARCERDFRLPDHLGIQMTGVV